MIRPNLLIDMKQTHSPDSILQILQQRSQWLQHVEKLLHTRLPAPLNQHCHLANIRENTLILQVDAPVWQTRLRYLIPELIEQWRRDPAFSRLATIDKVDARVNPLSPPSSYPTTGAVLTLSSPTAALLREAADQTTHTDLKAALLRLANHAADKGCK